MAKRTWIRGALTLALIGGLAAALIASPVGAANPVTKKKAKKIARKQSTTVFNNLIGPATDPFLATSENLVVANQGGSGSQASDPEQINSLTITAPFAGFLIINGSVETDEDGGGPQAFCLQARVDGTAVPPDDPSGCSEADETQGLDNMNIAYSVVAAVTAGAHTVTQDLTGSDGADDWFEANLVAQFVASGNVANVARQVSREG